jgi:hypothetical protein
VLQYNAANLGSIRYYIAYIIDGETGERRGWGIFYRRILLMVVLAWSIRYNITDINK